MIKAMETYVSDKSAPMVTVIVPVYNMEKRGNGQILRYTILSITNQTFKDFELLLIDDGSQDNTRALCEEFAKEDSRVKYYFKENGGVSSARNFGLDKAKGKYIVFHDADDLMSPLFLELSVNCVQETSSDIVFGEWNLIDETVDIISQDTNTPRYSTYEGNNLKKVPELFFYSVWAKIIKSDLIKNNGLKFNTAITRCEDTLFCFQLYLLSKRISHIGSRLMGYRKWSGTLTSGGVDYSILLQQSCLRYYIIRHWIDKVYQSPENEKIGRVGYLAAQYIGNHLFDPTQQPHGYYDRMKYLKAETGEYFNVLINDFKPGKVSLLLTMVRNRIYNPCAYVMYKLYVLRFKLNNK